MECWSIGELEYWKQKLRINRYFLFCNSITPLLHYSITPERPLNRKDRELPLEVRQSLDVVSKYLNVKSD